MTDKAPAGEVPAILVDNVTFSYGAKSVLLDVSFEVEKGRLVGLIGPNGSGKSTLLKIILGFLKADFGSVRIMAEPVERCRYRLAYVPQRGAIDWDYPITVKEAVLMGRLRHISWWRDPSAGDWQAVERSLERVRMTDYKDRQIGQLSGGQQQRVFLARALAQEADILVMDEPFAGVDAATEQAIMDVLSRFKSEGRTIFVVHHDLATAAAFFDRLILINRRVFAYGTPAQVLQQDLLSQVYEGRIRVPAGKSHLGERS